MANAVFYAAGFHLTFVAYRCGPFGLTKLLSTFSLLFPIFYGIFALDEEGGYIVYVCIALIFLSVFLVNQKKSNSDESIKISLKWFICILLSVISNGCISIITRSQQIRFDNACSNEFSVFSLAGAFILMMVLGFITERDKMGRVFKAGTLYGAAAGIFNGAKNFITLAIYLYLPLSVISPIKSGLNIVLTFATALLIYKERYTARQMLGVALGAAAVILLALQ
jgi:drug/metabolite transporter (DMT)-like permease